MTDTTFTAHADGRVTVNHWSETLEISTDLLARASEADAEIDGQRFDMQMELTEDELCITVSNGRALYRLSPETNDVYRNRVRIGRLLGCVGP